MKRQRTGKSKARSEYERLRANILSQVSYYKNRYGLILNTQIPKSYGELKRAGEIKGLAKDFEKLNEIQRANGKEPSLQSLWRNYRCRG